MEAFPRGLASLALAVLLAVGVGGCDSESEHEITVLPNAADQASFLALAKQCGVLTTRSTGTSTGLRPQVITFRGSNDTMVKCLRAKGAILGTLKVR
jgi:hypothetical protein